jgi:hypothetical protein
MPVYGIIFNEHHQVESWTVYPPGENTAIFGEIKIPIVVSPTDEVLVDLGHTEGDLDQIRIPYLSRGDRKWTAGEVFTPSIPKINVCPTGKKETVFTVSSGPKGEREMGFFGLMRLDEDPVVGKTIY